jgi:hypothetical protein
MGGYADLPPIIFQGTGLARLNTIRRLGVALDGVTLVDNSIEVICGQLAQVNAVRLRANVPHGIVAVMPSHEFKFIQVKNIVTKI